MKNIFIISTKNKHRPTKRAVERCKTKKQAFKRFQVLTGFFSLTFKEFLKSFLIYKY